MRVRLRVRYLALLALLLLAACIPETSVEPLTGRNPIVYGLSLEPSGIDPHRNRSAEMGIVLRQVYDTLVYRDPTTLDFVPGLAENWEVAPDGLTYTFYLRQGVTFHDGTAFNAAAVAANLDRITNPQTQSDRAVFMLGPYVGYDIVDDYTIRLLLAEPYTPLLDSLSQVYLGIASPAALAQYSVERYQFHQVGTGPFSFVEYVPANRIVLRRNQNYAWGPSFYTSPGDASIDVITFRFFSDPPSRTIALDTGDAQIVGELPPVDARALTGNSAVQLLPTAIPGQPLQFYFNVGRFPTDDIRVRQALLFGSNRAAIVDLVYQGFWTVAWGPLAPGTLYYNSQLQGAYSHDTVQAQQLLAEAGYADADGNGYLDFGDGDLSVTVIVPNWNFTPEVAQLLQDQWRTIGIRADLRPVVGFTALQQEINTGQYHLVAFNEVGFDPALLNKYFVTNASSNWTGFSDQRLDDSLFQAARELDPERRRTLYWQAQQIVMEQALILPIANFVNLNAASASVSGLAFDPYGWFPLLANVQVFAENAE